MAKLTKTVVDAASADPNGGRIYLWDSEIKGFGLQILPSGVKSYVLQYRTADNQTRRMTIGKHGSPWTVADARAKADELLTALRKEGLDPLKAKQARKEVFTVADLAEAFLIDGRADKPNKKERSWKTDEGNIRCHILPLLGKTSLKELDRADVAKFQRDVAAGKTSREMVARARGKSVVKGGKGIAARSLAVLNAMLEWGVVRGYLPLNPAKGVKKYKQQKMERFLSERDVATLAEGMAILIDIAMLSDTVADAIRLWLLTGCRRGEITGCRRGEIIDLKWSYVDFDRGCLRLPDSKTGAKVVPLSAPALKLLAERTRKPDCEWVLPSNRGAGPVVGVWKGWDLLRDFCGLEDVRIHDLRHSFASFAAADGASLFLIGKVLGHTQASTTERYAHLSDDPIRAVAERAAGKVANALGLDRNEKTAEVVPLPTVGKGAR